MQVTHGPGEAALSMLEMMAETPTQLHAVRLEPHGAVRLDTPVARGISLECEVQPGLRAAAHDVIWLADGASEAVIPPSLHCGILLAGQSAPLFAGDRPAIPYDLDRAVLVNFREPARCSRAWTAGMRSRGAGFVAEPHFLEGFAETLGVEDATLLAFTAEAACQSLSFRADPQLAALANNIIDNPYRGRLGDLFQEAITLRFFAETVSLLGRERFATRLLDRKSYQQVCDARDVLDSCLIAPPKTADLARQVGISLTILQRNFKLAFDTTLLGYVRDRRLDIARIQIVEYGRGVAETAYNVGYSNAAAFTAAYRRRFGQAPTKIADRKHDS